MGTLRDQLTAALDKMPKHQPPSQKAKPWNEKVWLYVKDHPNITAMKLADVYKSQGADLQRMSGVLSHLFMRGMVVREPHTKVNGHNGTQTLYYTYKVEPRMQGVYELWPMPEDKKYKRRNIAEEMKQMIPSAFMNKAAQPGLSELAVQSNTPPKPKAETPVQKAAQQATSTPIIDVEDMTVRQAREHFEKLKQLFGA